MCVCVCEREREREREEWKERYTPAPPWKCLEIHLENLLGNCEK